MHQVFGIRHHGPGSARSLLQALEQMQPDVLLIEGPADADALLPLMADEALIPPVALLVYNPKIIAQSSYFPFADFSPEWQAIQYALQKDILVQFMDLPQGLHFALNIQEQENTQLSIVEEETTFEKKKLSKADRQLYADPLAYMAQLAGYSDSERWWEVTFEQNIGDQDLFQALLEMMTALRAEIKGTLPRRELLREAFMRKKIREAIKKGYQKIAVVCGAWHAPALQYLENFKASTDNGLLKGIKKINTKATWVPWTYDRLSIKSGYGAGVLSPSWYQLLFHHPEEVVMRWMSRLARLFREEDLDASSAHVIEAVRLAKTLARLRGLPLPGIDELRESAISVFCEGDAKRLDLIADQLIIGNRIGEVPTTIPKIPLQQDLEKSIRSLRLSKLWQSPQKEQKIFDLRKPNQLAGSQLLHRLNILQIPWGKQIEFKKGDSAGSFDEKWKLEWIPDFAIRIIEAGMWGNTVSSASDSKLKDQLKTAKTLPELSSLIQKAFNANLESIFPDLIKQLQNVSVLTKDVIQLLDALPSLVNTYRYGSTRGLDLQTLVDVIHQLVPRICIALPNNCLGIDEDLAEDLFDKIVANNQAIHLLADPELSKLWLDALEKITTLPKGNALLHGACTRILFDKEIFSLEESAQRMFLALSPGNKTNYAAFWLEGFLHGSALLIIHNPRLWNILNQWIEAMDFLSLKNLLPLLRRTFSSFSGPERAKMMELAKQGMLIEPELKESKLLYSERAEKVLPTLKMLLGIRKE